MCPVRMAFRMMDYMTKGNMDNMAIKQFQKTIRQLLENLQLLEAAFDEANVCLADAGLKEVTLPKLEDIPLTNMTPAEQPAMVSQQVIVNKTEYPDSLEMGTPSKGGFKIYVDLMDENVCKTKLDRALVKLQEAKEGYDKIVNGAPKTPPELGR